MFFIIIRKVPGSLSTFIPGIKTQMMMFSPLSKDACNRKKKRTNGLQEHVNLSDSEE